MATAEEGAETQTDKIGSNKESSNPQESQERSNEQVTRKMQ
jgi:hypothetical protein